jgi:hypothetical protein
MPPALANPKPPDPKVDGPRLVHQANVLFEMGSIDAAKTVLAKCLARGWSCPGSDDLMARLAIEANFRAHLDEGESALKNENWERAAAALEKAKGTTVQRARHRLLSVQLARARPPPPVRRDDGTP